ncbi:hypothetical protein TNCV_3802881 [Trichonephila clavipes]|nr:hypothetical protein TNCV_3802881 [Trichonephila clavipes]
MKSTEGSANNCGSVSPLHGVSFQQEMESSSSTTPQITGLELFLPNVTTPNEDRYLAVTPKRSKESRASNLSRQLSSATATRGLLVTDHVILNHGQVTWTTPELAPPIRHLLDISLHDYGARSPIHDYSGQNYVTEDKVTPIEAKCISRVSCLPMPHRRHRASIDQVFEFDGGRIVAYRDCGLFFRKIGQQVG